jgi:hypothetical protein
MAAFSPFIVMGFIGYVISLALLGHVIRQDTYIHNAGVCVSTSDPVTITTPVIQAGNPYCDNGGHFVHTLPNGS